MAGFPVGVNRKGVPTPKRKSHPCGEVGSPEMRKLALDPVHLKFGGPVLVVFRWFPLEKTTPTNASPHPGGEPPPPPRGRSRRAAGSAPARRGGGLRAQKKSEPGDPNGRFPGGGLVWCGWWWLVWVVSWWWWLGSWVCLLQLGKAFLTHPKPGVRFNAWFKHV